MEDESRAERFINNFYSKPEHVINQVLLVGEYGISQAESYGLSSTSKLSKTYNLEFYYGFIRIDTETGNSNLFKHQSEYAFLGNISTNFKTFEQNYENLPTDSWRFGFGLSDGFGFLSNNNPTIFLNHSTAMSFIRIDFDGKPDNLKDTEFIKQFDSKFKFGQIYSGGIKYNISNSINLNFQYEMSQYYPNFEFGKWFGMWITDNILQRWIDYFETDLLNIFEKNYPWVKFVYKNFTSFILYQARKHQMYFPFKSSPPLYFDAYKFGITLIL